MNRKIISIEAHDGDYNMIDLELDNRNIIMLSLKSKLNELQFAEIINKRLTPQTNGERIYWQNGASLTLDEITAMLRADSSGDI